jgi:hypothetical protein
MLWLKAMPLQLALPKNHDLIVLKQVNKNLHRHRAEFLSLHFMVSRA